MKPLIFLCGTCIAVGVVVGMILSGDEVEWQPNAAQARVAELTSTWKADAEEPVPLTGEEQTNVLVYETANPSVVNISTTSIRRDQFFMRQWETEGSGSGALLDKQGHIITNSHVIDGASEIEVTLSSDKSFIAKLIGQDKEHDIAVLKIDAPPEDLEPIKLASSGQLRVGQRVYILGNPFSWSGTLTTGIISSLNRDLPSRVAGRVMQSLIQTDAAMNPGNSGGPLLNTQGKMIGMCVAIATKTGQNAGIGFAIPIDRIKLFVPDLIKNGRVIRANIGITDVAETRGGLIVRILAEDGPAEAAGLQGYRKIARRHRQNGVQYETVTIDRSQADYIVAVDGEPIRTRARFRDKIWEYQPGDVIQFKSLIQNLSRGETLVILKRETKRFRID